MPETTQTAPPECLAKWGVSRRLESYLKNGAAAPPTAIRAGARPPGAAPLGDQLDNGEYGLWLSADGQEVRADNKNFSDLTLVNIPNLALNKPAVIGAMPKPTPYGRPILQLLTNTGVLETFVHIGAELCLASEINKDGNYRAHVKAVHTYYTNERVDQPYEFTFEINTASGAITVERTG